MMQKAFHTIRRQIWYPVLALPLVLMIGVGVGMRRGYVGLDEKVLERIAIHLLSFAGIVSVGRLMLGRRPFFFWMSGMGAALLCREIHFVGTSTGFYIVLAGLIGLALLKYEALAEYLGSRTVVTLLAGSFFCYFIAQTLDQQWWRFAIGKPAWSGPLEEFIEVVGHIHIVLLTIVSRRMKVGSGSIVGGHEEAMNSRRVKWVITIAILLVNAVLLSVPSKVAYLVAQHRDVLLGRYGVSHFMTLLILAPVSLVVIRMVWRPKQEKSSRSREQTFKTIVLAGAIIIPIIGVDVAMRLAQPKRYVGTMRLFHRPPNVAKTGLIRDVPKTAFTYPVVRDGYPAMEFTLTGDKRGFRNKVDLEQYDVLMLGDSFTEGSDVSDDDIWPAVFAAKSGASVYNLGMSGGNPRTYLATLKKYLDEISPGTVVCMVYEGNDFRASNFKVKRSRGSVWNRVFKRSPLRRRFKECVIRIFAPLNTKRPVAQGRALSPGHPLYAVSCMPLAAPAGANAKYYAFELKPLLKHLVTRDKFVHSMGFVKACESLRGIKKRCDEGGVRLVVMYAPDKSHVLLPLVRDTLSPERFHAFMALKEKDLPEPDALFDMLVPKLRVREAALAEFCREEDLEFVSVTEPLREGIASGIQAYFTYDQHWTPPGHVIVAETLHRYFSSNGSDTMGPKDTEGF